jgi:peptidyl-prolyl cis-trans isomerase SurA
MKRIGRICTLTAILLGGGMTFFAPPLTAEVVDRIVAVVNDEIITYSELQQMAKALQAQPGFRLPAGGGRDLDRQLLESLINQKLSKYEAKRRGITVTEQEVNKAFEDFRKRNGLEKDEVLAQVLAKNGMTVKDMKQQIEDQLLHERLVAIVTANKVTISDAEVRAFYEREFPKTGGGQVHLKILSLPYPPGAGEAQKEEIRKKAELILEEFKKGVSWEQLRDRHGVLIQDLGFISIADLDPRLAQFLANVKPGETAPIQTLQGFQLVQLVARREGQGKSFAEVAPQIKNLLQRREMEKQFSEWIKGQRDRAHIQIKM